MGGFLLPTLPVGEGPDRVVGRGSARIPNGKSDAVRPDPLPGVEFVKAGGLVGGGGSGCTVDEALYEGGFAGFKVPHHDDSHFMLLLLLLAAHSGLCLAIHLKHMRYIFKIKITNRISQTNMTPEAGGLVPEFSRLRTYQPVRLHSPGEPVRP